MSEQRRRRRHSTVCNRHPSSKPTTGICAICLRERLSIVEVSVSASNEIHRVRSSSVRHSSVSVLDQPRRRSCDVRINDGDDDEEMIENSIRLPMSSDLKEEEEDTRGLDECEKRKWFVEEEIEDGEMKTMKELIDLESRNQQMKKNDGKYSVFSKFSLKHTQRNAGKSLGRLSCDVDPRLSLDGGRISFDEPRASWDGCLIEKTYSKLIPLTSVTEDVKASPEKITGDKGEDEEEKNNPGGTAQTRDYYFDSRRRRSFDRSSRHGLLEVDEMKGISNAKVSPETVGLFHGAKLLVTERELRDSNWYSIKNSKPESLEMGSKVATVDVKQDVSVLKKSGKKWSNFWGLIQRKTDKAKNEIKTEQSLKLGEKAMEGSLAESLLKLRRIAKGESNGDVSEKLIRSYSVSRRKSCDGGTLRGASIVNGFEGGRSSCDGLFHGSITGVETGRKSLCEDGLLHSVEGKRNHLLQRDTKLGTTYSPDNGMVRFYLTPLRSHVTSKSGKTRLMS